MNYTTHTDWQQALQDAEKHGWVLTWCDGFTVLYVAGMAVLGVIGAIIVLGGQ